MSMKEIKNIQEEYGDEKWSTKCSRILEAVEEAMNNARAAQVLKIDSTVGLHLILVNTN